MFKVPVLRHFRFRQQEARRLQWLITTRLQCRLVLSSMGDTIDMWHVIIIIRCIRKWLIPRANGLIARIVLICILLRVVSTWNVYIKGGWRRSEDVFIGFCWRVYRDGEEVKVHFSGFPWRINSTRFWRRTMKVVSWVSCTFVYYCN